MNTGVLIKLLLWSFWPMPNPHPWRLLQPLADSNTTLTAFISLIFHTLTLPRSPLAHPSKGCVITPTAAVINARGKKKNRPGPAVKSKRRNILTLTLLETLIIPHGFEVCIFFKKGVGEKVSGGHRGT